MKTNPLNKSINLLEIQALKFLFGKFTNKNGVHFCVSLHAYLGAEFVFICWWTIQCYGNIKNWQVLQFVASMAILKGDILDTQYEYTFILD